MILFENTCVPDESIEAAFRGMRNPLNSWDRSDSKWKRDDQSEEFIFIPGEEDINLAQRLIKAGSDHSKFMRMIQVYVDITAPMYWWKEFDTYKVGTVRNSCSTMHKIHAKEFDISDFAHEKLFNMQDEEMVYTDDIMYMVNAKFALEQVINALNGLRVDYLATKDKRYWYAMIQLLPSSYKQKATIAMNYDTVRRMIFARRNHKLNEWSVDFINWTQGLPLADELLFYT